eukprot:467456-Amphidinium_carterae.1
MVLNRSIIYGTVELRRKATSATRPCRKALWGLAARPPPHLEDIAKASSCRSNDGARKNFTGAFKDEDCLE